MDIFEALSLLESKEDQQKFIDKFGEEKWERFNSLKSRLSNKDLYYWIKQPKEELDKELDKAENKQTNKEKRSSAKSGAKLIAEDENWTCYRIFSYQASVYYGYDTEWCISMSNSPHETHKVYGPTEEEAIRSLEDDGYIYDRDDIENVSDAGSGYFYIEITLPPYYFFDDYIKDTDIIFFIAKKENRECFESDKWNKVAWMVDWSANSFYDAQDNEYTHKDDLPESLQEFIDEHEIL